MRALISSGFLMLSLSVLAETSFDKTEELNGVTLKSGKESSVRFYHGSIERNFSFPLEIVKKSITNFQDRCNNSYREKREFTEKSTNCRYHNENLIESFVQKDITTTESLKEFSEAYLVGRKVYNRSTFGYYELVTVKEEKVDNKKVVTIKTRMLSDDEAKTYTNPKISQESAFDKTVATYILTEKSPGETTLSYSYDAETDHWLLNKEVSVPQVFASISKSLNDLMESLESDASSQKRQLASKE